MSCTPTDAEARRYGQVGTSETGDRHSEILPEQNCDGELIELPDDGPNVLVVGRSLPSA